MLNEFGNEELVLVGGEQPSQFQRTRASAAAANKTTASANMRAPAASNNSKRAHDGSDLLSRAPGVPFMQQQDILTTNMDTSESSLPRARKKIKMIGQRPSGRIELTRPSIRIKNRASSVQTTSNHVRKPPEPQGAFFYHCASTRRRLLPLAMSLSLFVTLALCIFLVGASRTTATTTSDHRNHPSRINYIQSDLEDPTSSKHNSPSRRLISKYRTDGQKQQQQQREYKQSRLQQNQLKYLIARTASMPQLLSHGHFRQPLHVYEQHHQRRFNHEDNNIVEDSRAKSLPKSVQRTRSQPPAVSLEIGHGHSTGGTNEGRRSHLHIHKPHVSSLEESPLGELELLTDDVDSSDVGLADFDDIRDLDDDTDLVSDLGDGDDEDDDADEDAEDDEEEAEDGAHESEDEDYAAYSEGDTDEQNTIPLDGPRTNKDRLTGANRGLLYPSYSRAAKSRLGSTDHSGNNHKNNNNEPSGYPRLGMENELWNQSSSHGPGDSLGGGPYWGRARHHSEVTPRSSHAMVTTVSPVELEGLSRRQQQQQKQQHHLRKQKSQPSAPYQSPVVVSISDNSFVSASPVNLETSSLNDVDGLESPRRPEGATVHYSHIVAGPKNELPSYGRRYWHDSHIASIHMVQEEPNELHRGGINSAIIAILFGIGVTGMLIMIVSIKMRSIRERVAYKGRRRSLVPDTDFLINTIPM